MSGIFSRKMYDDCYQSNRLNQEISPGSYKINVDQVRNNALCVASNGTTNYRGIWYGPNEIDSISALSDIESHLKNLDLPDSRCLEGRTLEEKNAYANNLSKGLQKQMGMCSRNLEPSNTRLELSVLDVKMLPQTRFDFPIRDPRSFVYYGINMSESEQVGSNRFGVNTRLQAKDMPPSLYYEKLYNVKI
jgi:hypothetical protein